MSKDISIYDYMRNWFDFCFENPEMINPNHSALYFFILSHSNRLGWKPKFGLPTTMVKEAIGIKSYTTYIKTLNDIVSFGFVKMIEKSKNQYSSNIIALTENIKAPVKALDKATVKHMLKQVKSTCESNDSIDILSTNTPITNIQGNKRFTPPTLSEVLTYFEENGYTKQSGEKAFKYYETGNWKDSSGKQVKNWKQKMQSVWFKPENELKVIDFNSAPHRQNIYGGL